MTSASTITANPCDRTSSLQIGHTTHNNYQHYSVRCLVFLSGCSHCKKYLSEHPETSLTTGIRVSRLQFLLYVTCWHHYTTSHHMITTLYHMISTLITTLYHMITTLYHMISTLITTLYHMITTLYHMISTLITTLYHMITTLYHMISTLITTLYHMISTLITYTISHDLYTDHYTTSHDHYST